MGVAGRLGVSKLALLLPSLTAETAPVIVYRAKDAPRAIRDMDPHGDIGYAVLSASGLDEPAYSVACALADPGTICRRVSRDGVIVYFVRSRW